MYLCILYTDGIIHVCTVGKGALSDTKYFIWVVSLKLAFELHPFLSINTYSKFNLININRRCRRGAVKQRGLLPKGEASAKGRQCVAGVPPVVAPAVVSPMSDC